MKSQYSVGQKVYFGRSNGEKTLGEIVKLNTVKAKVKTLENRGNGGGSEIGSIWQVPYSLITPVEGKATKQDSPKAITYNRFDCLNNIILEGFVQVYSELSPENLTCDGELSPQSVHQKRIHLNQVLRGLTIAYGHEVSATEAFNWHREKINHQKAC